MNYNNLYNKKIVFYLLIIATSFFIINKINVTIKTFLIILVSWYSINFFNKYIKFNEENEKEIEEEKKEYIIPTINFNNIDNQKIVNFLFSIQEYHRYNPSAYEQFSDCLGNFYKVIKDTQKNTKQIYLNWELLEKYKSNIACVNLSKKHINYYLKNLISSLINKLTN